MEVWWCIICPKTRIYASPTLECLWGHSSLKDEAEIQIVNLGRRVKQGNLN